MVGKEIRMMSDISSENLFKKITFWNAD